MLPIGRKPVLQHVIEEIRACGITEALIVISPGKESIRKYFGDGERFGVHCDYAIQREMRGLGDAVRLGRDWVGARHFITAFGDCIIRQANTPPLQRVIATHRNGTLDATVLCETIEMELTSKYGILKPLRPLPQLVVDPFPLAGILEKPPPGDAPSNQAVAARWALSPALFSYLDRAEVSPGLELNLSDAVRTMIEEGGQAFGVPLHPGEQRWDIGGWETYLTATAKAAVEDGEFGDRIRAEMCTGET